jgi:hypothetical protein
LPNPSAHDILDEYLRENAKLATLQHFERQAENHHELAKNHVKSQEAEVMRLWTLLRTKCENPNTEVETR